VPDDPRGIRAFYNQYELGVESVTFDHGTMVVRMLTNGFEPTKVAYDGTHGRIRLRKSPSQLITCPAFVIE
jgi:hypothetical protein